MLKLLEIGLPATLIVSMMLACGSYTPREATPEPTREIAPTFTPQQLVASTPIVAPTATPLLVLEPTATVAAPVPTATSEPAQAPQAAGPTANDVANVRSGPGTEHATVGSVAAGQALTIVGRNAAGDWYQLADGNWIAAFLVTGAPGDLPVVEVVTIPPTAVPVVEQPTTVPVATDTPFVVATIAPPAAVCDCSGDNYKCDDFVNHDAAQACHDYCMNTVGSDIHKLDQDDNGDACESLQ